MQNMLQLNNGETLVSIIIIIIIVVSIFILIGDFLIGFNGCTVMDW